MIILEFVAIIFYWSDSCTKERHYIIRLTLDWKVKCQNRKADFALYLRKKLRYYFRVCKNVVILEFCQKETQNLYS